MCEHLHSYNALKLNYSMLADCEQDLLPSTAKISAKSKLKLNWIYCKLIQPATQPTSNPCMYFKTCFSKKSERNFFIIVSKTATNKSPACEEGGHLHLHDVHPPLYDIHSPLS